MNWTIVKTYFKSYLKSQIVLSCFIVEVLGLLIFIFGVKTEFLDGNLVSVSIFSSEPIYDPIFVKSFANISASIFITVLSLFYIVGVSEFYPNLVKNPLTLIILTRKIKRGELFISHFLGLYLAFAFSVIVFAVLIIIVILFKSEFTVFASFIALSSFIVTIKFLILAFLLTLFGSLTENSLTTSVLGIIFYFFVYPILGSQKHNSLAKIFYYITLPVEELKKVAIDLIGGGGDIAFLDIVIAFVLGILYFLISMIVFERREF